MLSLPKFRMMFLMLLLTTNIGVYAQEGDAFAGNEIGSIEVIGTTALGTAGINLDRYAGNVQAINSDTIKNANEQEVTDILINRSAGITFDMAQNNPYQNNIFYRGQQASPLVGTAIGLSVYLDGVRINEGFGDVLNWDLVPQSALNVVNLIPGSNPLYGLNTLGGAIALSTKSGHDFKGTELSSSGGFFGRYNFELQHGGDYNSFDWYINANYGEEDGWRDLSPSEVQQVFGKIGWENNATDIDLSYIYADNDLIGNGFAPEALLDRDRDASHTFPDQTLNKLNHINLQGVHKINELWQVSGNGFYRDYKRRTVNGDAEVECENDDTGSALFTELDGGRTDEDDALAPRFCLRNFSDINRDGDVTIGEIITADNGIDELFNEDGSSANAGDEVELESEGENRMTFTDSETYGGALQTTLFGDLFNRDNQFTFGIDYNLNETTFLQSEAGADLVQRGNNTVTTNADEQETEVHVNTEQENFGIFFTNTIQASDITTITFGGRWQNVSIDIRDLTGEAENQDLNASHHFNRFNPTGGATIQVHPRVTLFGNYSEGFRVPTAAELSCADEDDPCNLPNAFVADPPLDPVIARTVEIGARGYLNLGDWLDWNLALYYTSLKDDLLFNITETGGGGFFQNVDETLRKGLEFGVNGQFEDLNYFLNYSYIKATFETDITLLSLTQVGGEQVRKGDSIPGIPEHTLKFGAEYEFSNNFYFGGDVFASTGSYLRGDENNSEPRTDGYAILNLHTRYSYKSFEFWGRVENVFDTDYETTGILNFNANGPAVLGDQGITVQRFAAPGQPIAGFVGVRFRF